MARVGVEQQALSDTSDPRYKVLAGLIGVDRWSALGRMIVIWNICLESESYVLSEAVVNASQSDTELRLNGVQSFAEAIVKASLGKKHRHGIYICGTKGRIEWLKNKRVTARANGAKGGRPPKPPQEPIDNQDRLRSESPIVTATAITTKPIVRTQRSDVPRFAEESAEMKAARYFFAAILRNNQQAKEPNWQAWAKDFDRLFRIDGRDHAEVRRVIDWCQCDPFWLKNILSPAALRKQYDRLKLLTSNNGSGRAPTVRPTVAEPSGEVTRKLMRGETA